MIVKNAKTHFMPGNLTYKKVSKAVAETLRTEYFVLETEFEDFWSGTRVLNGSEEQLLDINVFSETFSNTLQGSELTIMVYIVNDSTEDHQYKECMSFDVCSVHAFKPITIRDKLSYLFQKIKSCFIEYKE